MDDKKISTSSIVLLVFLGLSILSFVFLSIFVSAALFLFVFLPVILFILIRKWISKTFASLVFSTSAWLNIVLIAIPLIAGLIVLDIKDFSQELSNNNKVLALQDNDLVFAAEFKNFEDMKNIKIYSSAELQSFKSNAPPSNKVVILIDKSFFDSVTNLKIMGMTLSRDEMFRFISSSNPEELIRQKVGVVPSSVKPDELKLILLVNMAQDVIKRNSPNFLISSYKADKIKIYPYHFSLELIKYLPDSLLEPLTSSIIPKEINKDQKPQSSLSSNSQTKILDGKRINEIVINHSQPNQEELSLIKPCL